MEVKMTQYNTTEDFSRVTSDEWKYGDENDGFVLTPFAREMMRDAIRQASTAFKEGREQIYFAMEVVSRVLAYALEEGRIALSKDQLFRGEGKPYVLDIIEDEEHREVPLRPYLEFGMEHVTCGESPEYIEELMVNRYLANGYAAEDALTAYIYCTSVIGLVYGVTFQQLLEYFASIVPDAETDRFNEFVEEKESQYKTQIYHNMCRKLEQKFKRWDEDKDIVQLDKNSMAKIFNKMLDCMEDESIKELMDNICNLDICHSLLGVGEETRRRIVALIPFSNRFYLMESWMNIPFNEEATENCLAAMGRVVYVRTAMEKEKSD